MNKRRATSLTLRYFTLIALGSFSLWLFYSVFTPLTVYPVLWIISFFDSTAKLLEGNVIFFSGFQIGIIPACVAGSAYYLLTILNLTTPMEVDKRIKSISFLLISFLILNIIRITLFAWLLSAGYQYFNLAHRAVWYIGSTVFVVALWFLNVYLFNIKPIPIYTDIKKILKDIKKRSK